MASNTRVDPRLIRQALALYDQHGSYRTAQIVPYDRRSINRWAEWRRQSGGSWPTNDDIETWHRQASERKEFRAMRRRQAEHHRKRTYLARGPMKVDATGTARKLQALQFNGFTSKDIASELVGACRTGVPVTSKRVSALMLHYYPLIHRDTAAAVDGLFRRWCMVIPTDEPTRRRGQVRRHERARRQARRKGWVGALAWDNIDDPDSKPTGIPGSRGGNTVDETAILRRMEGDRSVRLSYAERCELRQRWIQTGRSLNEMTRITGIQRVDRYAA